MLLRRIYAGQIYPHIYILSISTGKNQSTKVRGHYTFQHMSTIKKLSWNVIQHYKNITSPIGATTRIQRNIQLRIVTKYS